MQIPEKEFAFFLCPLKNTPLALLWKYKQFSIRGNFIHSLLFSQFYADLIKISFFNETGERVNECEGVSYLHLLIFCVCLSKELFTSFRSVGIYDKF